MPEQVHSVSDITADIRAHLENEFQEVWVEGEVSNLRRPGSGHSYFTLKDSFAQLSCVFFKGAAARSPVELRDGLQVQVRGDISVYEARGQYQLIAKTVQTKGAGDLQARFEALKRKLEEEGLFSPERKKPLPIFPTRIGIVTSPTGAAIRDMLNIFARRAPWIQVVIHPARVQGDEAAGEIVQGIKALEEGKAAARPDLIIVARGGGSIEDLWPFNEERVARAIADCSVPVLSGVGHEIDFTIADFVADRREPTPSAAAENATQDGEILHRQLMGLSESLRLRATGQLDRLGQRSTALFRELQAREPGRRLQTWTQSLDFLGERLESVVEARLQEYSAEIRTTGRGLEAIQPVQLLNRAGEDLERAQVALDSALHRAYAERAGAVTTLGQLLHSLSPDATVQRGFTLTLDETGKPVTRADSLQKGDRLTTRFSDGEATSVVE